MKTKLVLFFVIALAGLNCLGQLVIKPGNNKNAIPTKMEVNQLSVTKWNEQDGIPYIQVPGANLGAISFELLGKNRVAFLCNSTNEIIIINISDGKVTKKIPVFYAPRDFVYDDGLFYVLGERKISIYDFDGKEKNQFPIPYNYIGTERLARFNNSTFLLHGSGNCLMIESRGIAITPVEYEGFITGTGNFIKTKLVGDYLYSVKIILPNGMKYEKILSTDKKVAGAYVVGATKNRIVLDIQTFISESPISVERSLVSITLENDTLREISTEIEIPDCYYVYSNKDFFLSPSGKIFNMLTSPLGVYIFSLCETKSKKSHGYPIFLTKLKYHFNNHLIEMDNK